MGIGSITPAMKLKTAAEFYAWTQLKMEDYRYPGSQPAGRSIRGLPYLCTEMQFQNIPDPVEFVRLVWRMTAP
jgi:hypothetical protein